MSSLGPRLLWVLPIITAMGGGWAVHRAWQAPPPETPAVPVAAQAVSDAPTLSPHVLVRLFELPSTLPPAQVQTALRLKASVVAGANSRILVEHASQVHGYQVGDTLPDGSQLREVNAHGAVLWRGGETVLLPFPKATASPLYLRAVEGQPAAGTKHHLRLSPLVDIQS